MSDLSLSPDSHQTHSVPLSDALLNAFTAVRHLHPKQLTLLSYLNSRRDPGAPHQTMPLSYTHLHHATGITIEHIRRNGLHRLFASGLLSVVVQGFGGTIYRLHFDADILSQVIHKVGMPVPIVPAGPSNHHQDELAALEERLTIAKQLQECRRAVQREEFEAHLALEHRRWFTTEAKRRVDNQDGIRFIRDRFPQYEAERLRLIDEWIARRAYGEALPIPSAPESEESSL